MAKVPPPTPCSHATNKRGPSAPLSGSSSEGENSDLEDIPPSPCSSTSSGPIYVRPAGFNHHAQEIVQAVPFRSCRSVKLKKKIKKNALTTDNLPCQQGTFSGFDQNNNTNNNNVRTAAPPSKAKQKPKKDPLPMKLRALPQSFWQQPNSVNAVPPGSMYTVLPPVCKTDPPSIAEITDTRPITPPSDSDEKESLAVVKSEKPERAKSTEKPQPQDAAALREGALDAAAVEVVKSKPPKPPPRRTVRVSASSADLLAKLFDGIENDKKAPVAPTAKRGRPKRESSHPHHSKLLVNKDDPYMIDAVSDSLLPLLSIESSRQSVGPASHLSVVSVKDGDKTLTLPALNVEQNYPAMLTELVKAL
ncbi:uncharacterized protein LOC110976517 [Acanthaster planci]|uniref:Uncharacterized protein LOC110976517 n=1 Tax=Acanthaster planci TaxID=133434 RepID=A0A8B7XZS9_ACAPL|nr:uncharacterized protein LOC110976517 [Acanthaster planci]